jgi:hypothetical protein
MMPAKDKPAMSSQPGLSPASRKWIVNAGLLALGILAIFAVRDLHSGKRKASDLNLPERLSCSLNAAPSDWENGRLHFDFGRRLMLNNGGRKRLFTADQVSHEGEDQVLHIVGFLEPSGQLVRKADTIRVHPVSRVGSGNWEVRVSDAAHGSADSVRMICLGMT